jgi:molecular chaperone GrpE (heat shock protein)
MAEVANQVNNSTDKVASLMKEAENLKQKLEEERQKLNDVTCKIFSLLLLLFLFQEIN